MVAECNDGFMIDVRRFLKGDEESLKAFAERMRRNPKGSGLINYIASHDGFTLCDLVSYEERHNEDNGEQNRDGRVQNYSWNCGEEGKSRKKKILELRNRQMKNAWCMLLLSAGTPMILAGDEFCNSQLGNNNPYCLDNEISWLDWKGYKSGNSEMFRFVKDLIAFRKKHKILHMGQELSMTDSLSCGFPGISYHSSSAWYGELDGQELAVEALRRIVQAELMGQFYKLKYFAGDLQREIRYPVSEMQESLWKKNLSLARGAFLAEEVDDFYHTLRLGELPHGTCLSYRTGSQRECLLAAFDSNKKIVLVKKDEAVVARACLRLTKGAFQKPPAIDFSFADLSQENTATGKSAAGEKAVLFLESVYTSRLNDIEKEEVMKLAVSLTTQKAAELGVVSVLARRYLGCYERDEYVLAPFYVYISKSKNGWQYLDSLGGAAYTSAKEEYVEHPFLVMQTAMHQAEANSRNEVEYE